MFNVEKLRNEKNENTFKAIQMGEEDARNEASLYSYFELESLFSETGDYQFPQSLYESVEGRASWKLSRLSIPLDKYVQAYFEELRLLYQSIRGSL